MNSTAKSNIPSDAQHHSGGSDSNPVVTVLGIDDSPHKCFTCDKEIADGGWFCRLPRGGTRIVLCSPGCAIRYFDAEQATAWMKGVKPYERTQLRPTDKPL